MTLKTGKLILYVLVSLSVCVPSVQGQVVAVGEGAKESLARAHGLSKAKKHSEARQVFLEVAERDAATTYGLYAKFHAAKCLFQEGDLEGFKTAGQELLRDYPLADKRLIYMTKLTLGKTSYRQGEWEEAATALDEVVNMDPSSSYAAEALGFQADALRRTGRFDEARAMFLKMGQIKHTPQNLMEAQHRAAQCLFEAGKYVEFGEEINGLFAQNPPADNHWVQMTRFERAHLDGKLGNPGESALQLDAFMGAHPNFRHMDLAHQRCGYYYMQASDKLKEGGNTAQAQVYAQRAKEILDPLRVKLEKEIAADPKKAANYSYRMRIIDCYYYQHDYIGMVDAAQKLVDGFEPPNKLWGLGKVWLGIALSQQDKPYMELAAKHFQDVLDANIIDEKLDDHVPANAARWRAWAAQEMKDPKALAAAVEKLEAMPDGPVKREAMARFAAE